MFGFTLPATAYKIVAEVGVVLALCIGSFFYGKHVGDLAGEVKLQALQLKLEKTATDLLGLQTITNEKIVTQVVTKVVHIHDQANTINGVIPDVTDRFPLSLGWLSVYNASATGSEIDPTSAANGTSSGLAAADALYGINRNDEMCRADQAKLKGLQDWITQYNLNVDAVNAAKKK